MGRKSANARHCRTMLLGAKANPNFPKSIVLASGSPRRKEILGELLHLQFDIVKSTFAEDLDKSSFASPREYVMATAAGKAREVFARLEAAGEAPALLISADTVISLDGTVLEKPSDAAHAHQMLSSLSGRSHEVATGVVLLRAGAEPGSPPVMHSFSEVTKVTFHDLSSQTIDAYIAPGEPFDKAGGYGIQATAASFVSGIEGCYFNVVGFPAARFCQELLQWWPLE